MRDMTPQLRAFACRATVSLAAWQLVEALATSECPTQEANELIERTGIDVDTATMAIEALLADDILQRHGMQLGIAPACQADATALVMRMRTDRALRLCVLKLAAMRECSADHIRLTVAWAPEPPLDFSEPPAYRSPASSAPGAPGPSR